MQSVDGEWIHRGFVNYGVAHRKAFPFGTTAPASKRFRSFLLTQLRPLFVDILLCNSIFLRRKIDIILWYRISICRRRRQVRYKSPLTPQGISSAKHISSALAHIENPGRDLYRCKMSLGHFTLRSRACPTAGTYCAYRTPHRAG